MRTLTAAEAYEGWLANEYDDVQMEYLTDIGKWVGFSFVNREGVTSEGYLDIWGDAFDRRVHENTQVRIHTS